MNRECFSLLLALALAIGAASAQDLGSWRAVSTTAESITGDVAFGDETVTINFASFPIAQIRPLTTAEAVAVFTPEPGVAGSGNVYRVSIPAARKFRHKNTLCGAEETEWMVTYVSARTLQLAFFSGEKIPAMSPEALATTTSLCGTYTYVR